MNKFMIVLAFLSACTADISGTKSELSNTVVTTGVGVNTNKNFAQVAAEVDARDRAQSECQNLGYTHAWDLQVLSRSCSGSWTCKYTLESYCYTAEEW